MALTSESYTLADDPEVLMQNAEWGYWAYATHAPDDAFPVVVKPDIDQHDLDDNRIWKRILVDSHNKLYHIQHLGTKNYAWVSESAAQGTHVLLKGDSTPPSKWKIEKIEERGDYRISFKKDADPETTRLYWTEKELKDGVAVTLEPYTAGGSGEWKFQSKSGK